MCPLPHSISPTRLNCSSSPKPVIDGALAALRDSGGIDAHQSLAYDVAHAASALATARASLALRRAWARSSRDSWPRSSPSPSATSRRASSDESVSGPCETTGTGPSRAFVADLPRPRVRRRPRRERRSTATSARTSRWSPTPFTASPLEQVRPHAEHVHRANADIPESVIAGLAELGGFGLSVPEEFGGFASGGESEYLGMVVATEELSWGALGVGGSLITRPEILTRALVHGGTHGTEGTLAAATGVGRGPRRGRGDRAGFR